MVQDKALQENTLCKRKIFRKMHFSLVAPQGAINFAAKKEGRGSVQPPDSKMKVVRPEMSGSRPPDHTKEKPGQYGASPAAKHRKSTNRTYAIYGNTTAPYTADLRTTADRRIHLPKRLALPTPIQRCPTIRELPHRIRESTGEETVPYKRKVRHKADRPSTKRGEREPDGHGCTGGDMTGKHGISDNTTAMTTGQ